MTLHSKIEDLVKSLAVGMYLNGRTDVTASSSIGVTPNNLNHAEPIMEVKVSEATSAILKEVYEEVERLIPEKAPHGPVDTSALENSQPWEKGYNIAIDQFKSNLKELMEGK